MDTNTTIADQNTERLIQAAYEPDATPPAFAAQLEAKLIGEASALAKQAMSTPRRPRGRLRWAVLIGGGLAACVAIVWALLAWQQPGQPIVPTPPQAKKPLHIDALQTPVNLAKWTDDVRESMMPRQRPAAPALAVLGAGQTLTTKAGQPRLVQLSDGSLLYVNEKSEVEATGTHQLTLLKGQIYLEVAPREDAPRFVVKTGKREISATGTHFGVQTDPISAGVLVTQGKVAVTGIAQEVTAGQQVELTKLAVSAAPRASHSLAWTRALMAAAETPMVPACQHAGGALLALDPQGQEIKLALRRYHVDVHVEDGFARTTIDQTYFNTTWERLEGTFYFPLPADASLSRLAMYVVDGNQCKLMEGGMAERKHAADVYETIRYQRRDPALLEWLDGSTFKMRVFPLEAKQEKRIVLSYTQKLPLLYGIARYRFAGGHNMPLVREWSFNARVRNGANMNVSSPTHPDAIIVPGGDTLVQLFANNAKPHADVGIDMQERDLAIDKDLPRFASFQQEKYQYLMVRYRPALPSLPERQRRDWIVLFESSAQRDPLLAGTQVDVLRHILKNAEYDDTFTVLTVNTRVQTYSDKPQPARPKNVDAALKALQDTHLVGALDLQQGLQAALKLAKEAKNPHLLHIGSGIPAMGQRDAGELARLLPASMRYVGVGVGKRWNRAFMKAAAERTSGVFTQINPDEVIAWRAFELLATLNTPRLLDVKVMDAERKTPFLMETSMIAQGEELCAVIRVDSSWTPLPGKVLVQGTLEGKPFVKEFPVVGVMTGAGYLPRTWAKQEIDRLLADNASKHKDEIITLSKAMYVMSPFTSLLVLETDADYEKYKVDKGRKDHWAMYACPAKIPLVYEPDGKKPPVKDEVKRKSDKPGVTQVLGTITNALYVPDGGTVTMGGEVARVGEVIIVGNEVTRDRVIRRMVHGIHPGQTLRTYPVGDLILNKDDPAPWGLDSGTPPVHFPPLATWQAIQKIRKDKYIVSVDGARVQDDVVTVAKRHILANKRAQMAHDEAGHDNTQFSLRLLDTGLGPSLTLKNPIEFPAKEYRARTMMSENIPIGSIELDLKARIDPIQFSDRVQFAPVFVSPEMQWAVPNQMLLGAPTGGERAARMMMTPPGVDLGVEIGLQSPLSFSRPVGNPDTIAAEERYRRALQLYRTKAIAREDLQAAQLGWLKAREADDGLLYQRPQFDYDRILFTDLQQYAPGLHNAPADIYATLEAEADVELPKLGNIDADARKLIDRARSAGWMSLTIPEQGPIPAYKVHYNGIGQFAYERILVSGLREEVVCDGKTLWHLYPEIGLAAKRPFSRHHHGLAAGINPAFLPAAEELARGFDVKAVDAVTVALVPHSTVHSTQYSVLHLVFGRDGRLAERRVVEMPKSKTLLRQIFQADGSIDWQDADGKSLAKHTRTAAPAKAPTLQPKIDKLLVMAFPIRTREHIAAQASKSSPGWENQHETAVQLFLADMTGPTNRQGALQLGKLLHDEKERRLGFYVLLNAANTSLAAQNLNGPDGKHYSFDIEKDHPNSALATFLAQGQREIISNDQGLLKELPDPKDGFIQRLARFRNLWLTWHHNRATDVPRELAKVIEFLNDTPSPTFAYAVLDTMQRRANKPPTDRMLEVAVKRFGPISDPLGLGYVFRYEHARALQQAGVIGEASKRFRELHESAASSGALPPIDANFRDALQMPGNDGPRFIAFTRKTLDALLAKKRYGLAFQLARQVDQLGDDALGEEILTTILAKAGAEERNAVTLMSIRVQTGRKQFAQADRMLTKLLEDKKLAEMPELWRWRVALTKETGQAAASIACLEKALDLEYAALPELVNLESIRADYRALLDHYRRIAEASASLQKGAPKAFLAKVIRTADRWRLIDQGASEPCRLAGKIFHTVGEHELAWDYWTTPIDLQPAESKPWLDLGETMQAEGDLDRADRAFGLAFDAEPTNPEILLKRAQNHVRLGQVDRARQLYRQIADGAWQERFAATVEQARGLAGN